MLLVGRARNVITEGAALAQECIWKVTIGIAGLFFPCGLITVMRKGLGTGRGLHPGDAEQSSPPPPRTRALTLWGPDQ